MQTLLGVLTVATVALIAPIDFVSPIIIGPEQDAVAWTVGLEDRQTSCHAKAWIGRMGEQSIANLFVVDLDEAVVPTAESESPLHGLPPGSYGLHFESDGCW